MRERGWGEREEGGRKIERGCGARQKEEERAEERRERERTREKDV